MNKLIYNRRTTTIVTVKGHNEDRTLSHLFCFLLDPGTRALNKWWTEWNYYEQLCKQLWSIENNILNVSARKEVIFMEKGIVYLSKFKNSVFHYVSNIQPTIESLWTRAQIHGEFMVVTSRARHSAGPPGFPPALLLQANVCPCGGGHTVLKGFMFCCFSLCYE